MLTNATISNFGMQSNNLLSGDAKTTVFSLVNNAKETLANANKLSIKGTEQERSLISTCPKALSVQCLEGLAPTHLQSPFGSVITGEGELYVPNAWGNAIYVDRKDLDVLCAGNFDDVQKFVSNKNNNETASLEDMRKYFNGGEVFCATEPLEAAFVRDSFKKKQPAQLVIKDNVITPECSENEHKVFKSASIPWDITSGFRRTAEDDAPRNLKKRKKKRNNSGSSGDECPLPHAQCKEELIPAHKRIIPGTSIINALGKDLDIYFVPNSLGQTIQTNEQDVGISCVRDWSELQQAYNKTKGVMPTFQQVRDDMGGGELYCTNKVPDDKLYPTAFVVKMPASYTTETTENNTETIVGKCPEGMNSVFITNPEPTTFGEADIGNKIKIIASYIMFGLMISAAGLSCICKNEETRNRNSNNENDTNNQNNV